MRTWSVGLSANEIRPNFDVNFIKISLFGQLFGHDCPIIRTSAAGRRSATGSIKKPRSIKMKPPEGAAAGARKRDCWRGNRLEAGSPPNDKRSAVMRQDCNLRSDYIVHFTEFTIVC